MVLYEIRVSLRKDEKNDIFGNLSSLEFEKLRTVLIVFFSEGRIRDAIVFSLSFLSLMRFGITVFNICATLIGIYIIYIHLNRLKNRSQSN